MPQIQPHRKLTFRAMTVAGVSVIESRQNLRRLILPSSFWNLNDATEHEQTDWRNRSGAGKDEPHDPGVARSMFRTKGGEQPAARSDQKFADQKREIGKRTIRRFLARRRNSGGVFVHPRRV